MRHTELLLGVEALIVRPIAIYLVFHSLFLKCTAPDQAASGFRGSCGEAFCHIPCVSLFCSWAAMPYPRLLLTAEGSQHTVSCHAPFIPVLVLDCYAPT